MTCKDCRHFSNAYGGTCFGWADLSETNSDAEVGSCSRFTIRSNKVPEYNPGTIEEYSEYDCLTDCFPRRLFNL